MAHVAAAGFFGLGRRRRATDEAGAARPRRWYDTWLAKTVIGALAVATALGAASSCWNFALNLTTRGGIYKTDLQTLHRADSALSQRLDRRDSVYLSTLAKISVDVSYMRGRMDGRDRGYARRDTAAIDN